MQPSPEIPSILHDNTGSIQQSSHGSLSIMPSELSAVRQSALPSPTQPLISLQTEENAKFDKYDDIITAFNLFESEISDTEDDSQIFHLASDDQHDARLQRFENMLRDVKNSIINEDPCWEPSKRESMD